MNQTTVTVDFQNQIWQNLVPIIISSFSVLVTALLSYILRKLHISHKNTKSQLTILRDGHEELKNKFSSQSDNGSVKSPDNRS